MIPQPKDVSLVQISTYGHGHSGKLKAEHAGALWSFRQPIFVGWVGTGLQSVLLVHESVAKDVVEVQVGVQQVLYCQSFFGDELLQLVAFFGRVASGINHCGFTCPLVPHHVGVDGQHIEFKLLDFHNDKYFLFFLSLIKALFLLTTN